MANNVDRSFQQPVRQSPDMRRTDHAAQAPIQFVFIDESSRDSKRSKITRACISCRRRKIKCVWGGEICTSCQRLGTECVVQAQEGVTEVSPYTSNARRTSGDDGEFEGSNKRAQERRLSASTPTNSTADTHHSVSPPSSYTVPARTTTARRPAQGSRRTSHKTSQGTLAMASKTPLTDSMPGVNTLTDIFGGLHINQGGIAGYINDDAATSMNDDFYTKRMASDMFPVISEWPVTHDEIASLLPPNDLAFDLLNIFFDDLHPYLPVVNRQLFFQDYVSDRTVISPYLLLSIFALAARFSEDPRVLSLPDEPATRGDIWWDLIQRYKDDFRDSARLSTVQADVLNLKNLESRPETKGYWYRAWFNLSCTLRMCKDLGLHHVNRPMVADPDAVAGRRVWQVCFIYDQMMASSQGREVQLDMSLVDLTLLPSLQIIEHDFTEEEVNLHNDFVFMVGLLKILRRGTVVFRTVGIKFPFAADPSYPAISDVLEQWHKNLPDRLRYCPFKDERLSSHFVGQLHLTYCLITCLLHRPWIVSVGAYGASGEWRTHLRKCNEAARAITATYEALFRQYGSRSVQLMLRGNYYAMYVCVVATMIHAVSLTCPEQEFSEGASDFFSRSLSILDRLAVILSTPMMRKQIEVLRGIFASASQQQSARFDPQTLPPELASLQEQYRKIQQQQSQQALHAKAKVKSPSQVHRLAETVPHDVFHYPSLSASSFTKDSLSSYGDASQLQYYAAQDTYTGQEPSVLSMQYGSQLDAGTLASSPASIHPDGSPSLMQVPSMPYPQYPHMSPMHWNPAGLINAWNSNFPSASMGIETTMAGDLASPGQLDAATAHNIILPDGSLQSAPVYYVPTETDNHHLQAGLQY